MQNNFNGAEHYVKQSKKRSVLYKTMAIVSAIIVFATTYALILPAITLEAPSCGYDEHTHTESCYAASKKLSCGLEETDGHIHNDNCYDAKGNVICGKEECEPHSHNEDCYSVEKELKCKLEEHTHSDECENATTVESTTEQNPVISAKPMDVNNKKAIDIPEGYVNIKDYIESVDPDDGYLEETLTQMNIDTKKDPIEVDPTAASGWCIFDLNLVCKTFDPDNDYYYTFPDNYPTGLFNYILSDGTDEERFPIEQGDGKEVGYYIIKKNVDYIYLKFTDPNVQNFDGYITLDLNFNQIVSVGIKKDGYYFEPTEHSTDGKFHFEITADIPLRRKDGENFVWNIYDKSNIHPYHLSDLYSYNLKNANFFLYYSDKEHQQEITGEEAEGLRYAEYTEIPIYGINDDEEVGIIDYKYYLNNFISVNKISEVYDDSSAKFAYWIDEESDAKNVYLLNRSECTESTCYNWDSENNCCNSISKATNNHFPKEYADAGWSACWSLDVNSKLLIAYAEDTVYGGDYDGASIMGSLYETGANEVTYNNYATISGESNSHLGSKALKDSADAHVVGVKQSLDKSVNQSTSASDDYAKHYTININENKQFDYSKIGDGAGGYLKSLTINDVMTNLIYAAGTLVVKRDGVDLPLEDYSTEIMLNKEGNETVGCTLKIVLNQNALGQSMYTLKYDAQPIDGTAGMSNSVSINLSTDTGSDNPGNPSFTKSSSAINRWRYVQYNVKINKVDLANNDIKLNGATYGLYDALGTHIASEKSGDFGEDGVMLFTTNAKKGIIYAKDTLYYIQEEEAPEGYALSSEKIYFFFTNNSGNVDTVKAELAAKYGVEPDAIKSFVKDGNSYNADITVVDTEKYTLPLTGGNGTLYLTLTGAILVVTAICFMYIRYFRRKEDNI
ncbi:MAG: hypothetical protein MJ089_07485 [Ruminococcus sp.]|nr:hypothetical protein [Ruminococcus sp.]